MSELRYLYEAFQAIDDQETISADVSIYTELKTGFELFKKTNIIF